MTHQERAAIEALGPPQRLLWRPDADPRFVRLLAGPCPLLNEAGLCSVYDVRPMNCRRYMCGRQDGEAWTPESIPVRVLESRDLRRQYALNERKAQRWGLAHGWES